MSPSLWLQLAVRFSAFALAILWPAGTWMWWQAWVLIAIWLIFAFATGLYLSRHDPALLAERLKASPVQEGQKTWDKILMTVMLVPGIALAVVPGLDVVRLQWSTVLPAWAQLAALILHLPCLLAVFWVMRENTFLSRVVKIDKEREHHLIRTGPYAVVRHPMYSAIIVLVLATPVALGSRYGLVPAAILIALLVLRTCLEDRTLHEELPGYPDYAQEIKYRLIPGVW
jgi:protein-S-isoprenylcysteine O-methyltransferase Ste14